MRAIGARRMDAVDQGAFVVALEAGQLTAGFLRDLAQALVNLGQCRAAVDGGLARAEQVQVRTMQNQDVHAGVRQRLTAGVYPCESANFTPNGRGWPELAENSSKY